VTIFDPNDFRDEATYAVPHRYPSGACTTVIVNGTIVIKDATHTGATPGVVLRRAPTAASAKARARLPSLALRKALWQIGA
jgi:N-acyl-D-aspartate/D-glutamate deacylase